jgi:hypothetical protein
MANPNGDQSGSNLGCFVLAIAYIGFTIWFFWAMGGTNDDNPRASNFIIPAALLAVPATAVVACFIPRSW